MVTASRVGAGVIEHLDQQLAEQRAANTAGYDREQALVDLRSLALDVAVARNAHDLTPEQLWGSVETPEENARLRSLIDRALAPEEAS